MANEDIADSTISDPAVSASPEASSDSAHSWMSVVLSTPLSRVQAVVGVLAGCLTIVGTLVSYTGLTRPPAPVQGELVAFVQLGRTHKPLTDATVEILTPQDALVTTMTPEHDGRVIRKLKEGRYRVRVTHPTLMSETRTIEVHAGQQSQLRVAMVPRPAPRIVRAMAVTTVEQPGPVRKFFRDLGF